MKIGVFIDVMDIFNNITRKFNCHLNYKAYLENCLEDDVEDTIIQAIAYGSQFESEAIKFIRCLKAYGYIVKYKKPKIIRVIPQEGKEDKKVWRNNWEVGIALDVVEMHDKIDRVILGVSDSIYIPLVEFLRKKGIFVTIFACNISKSLASFANEATEINNDILVPKKNHEDNKATE